MRIIPKLFRWIRKLLLAAMMILSFTIMTSTIGIIRRPILIDETVSSPQERYQSIISHMKLSCTKANNTQNKLITDTVLDHIHFDRKRKILYCFVPKVACTSWKRVWMKTTGLVGHKADISQISRNDVHTMIPRLSFLEPEEQQKMLDTYKKFILVRNPLSRILSAYKDKFQREDRQSLFSFHGIIGRDIERKYRKTVSGGHNITFGEFIRYISEPGFDNEWQNNEHWASVYKLCNPCAVNYDVIGQFEHLREDANFILNWMGVGHIVPSFPVSDMPTGANEELYHYYGSLSRDLKKSFHDKFFWDFEGFGYKSDVIFNL